MAWINIASKRFELRQKLLKSLEGWESGIDVIGDHRLGLYALMCGDEKLYERTKKFTAQWLEYYSGKDNKTLAQDYVFPIFTGLSVLGYLQENHATNRLSRVLEVKLPAKHSYRPLQDLIKEYLDGESTPTRAPEKGPIHFKSDKEWGKLVTKLTIDTLFDLAICPDHPSWLTTLSDYCLPLALLLSKAENSPASIGSYLQLGAAPRRHNAVLFERKTAKPLIEAEVTSNKNTWPGFDAVELIEDVLFAYYWTGFDWHADLDFDPTEKLNAFRPLLFLEHNWQLVKDAVDSSTWSVIQQHRHDGKVTYVVLYDDASTEETVKETEKAREFLKEKIRVASFLAV